MQTASELKTIFQDGWNNPERVDNYVRNVANGEFQDTPILRAWRECLEAALAAEGRLQILDVGTGPGVYACLYSEMGHQCTGLDFSDRMLTEAWLSRPMLSVRHDKRNGQPPTESNFRRDRSTC